MIVIDSVHEQRNNREYEWKSRRVYITRNACASQFLGDETATMGCARTPPVQTMRGHPLFALTAERERGGEEGERYIDVDEGEWGRREGQNAGSAAYNAGRRSQSGRNAITLTRNPITYSFA